MAPRRAAGRLSGGRIPSDHESIGSSPKRHPPSASRPSSHQSERQQVLAEAERARHLNRIRSHSRSTSRTPSPILAPSLGPSSLLPDATTSASLSHSESASWLDSTDPATSAGHLSVPALGLGLGPTKEELEILIYGSTHVHQVKSESDELANDADASDADVDQMLHSLSTMGLDDPQASVNQRERQLAEMIKKLALRCTDLVNSRDAVKTELETNRMTALSVISSMKTTHARVLAAERGVRDRLEAELDGWKAQAKMLSTLLSRAEARGYDERRIVSAADRAKNLSAAWPSSSRLPISKSDDSIAKENVFPSPADSASHASAAPPASLAPLAANEPMSPSRSSPRAKVFEPQTPAGEESRGRDRRPESLLYAAEAEARSESILGPGISNPGGLDPELDDSPMSAVVRERNKLATDKRYLKARVKDAEAQVHRLETELKSLRPYLVAGGIKLGDEEQYRAHATAAEAADNLPTTPSRSGGKREKSRRKKPITMGDAETEHLLLAARRLREIRKDQAAASASTAAAASSSTVASVLAPPAEVGPEHAPAHAIKRQASEGLEANETAYGTHGSPRTPPTRTGERPPKTPKSNNASIPSTPKMSLKSRHGASQPEETNEPWTSHHKRFDSSVSASSFTGIDELLQAAETLNPGAAAASSPSLTPQSVTTSHRFPNNAEGPGIYYPRDVQRGGYPPHHVGPLPPPRGMHYDSYGRPLHPVNSSPARLAHESPKRRRVSSAALDIEPFGSPFASDRLPRGRTNTEGADPYLHGPPRGYAEYAPSGASSAGASQGLSALDLLADQAAASQNPSLGSDRSGDYDGVSPIGSLSSEDEAMAVDGDGLSGSKKGKANSRASSSQRSGKSPQRGSQKGTSANGSQNLSQGSSRTGDGRSFGGNQNPEKRLPYVRWTSEEDTKLRAAIKEHGQRWELISRAVGTRSYHQCRQRYLLMRRKEAAAKAQAEAEEAVNTASASASDQHSQDEGDYGRGPPPSASVSRRKSTSRREPGSSRGGRSTNDEQYDDQDELSDGGSDRAQGSTPLHKLSIGAPGPGPGPAGSGASHNYGSYSPTARHAAFSSSSRTPTHSRSLSHSHGLSPIQQSAPLSPYSHQNATPTARRGYYPPPSPLNHSSRQLAPLSGGGYTPGSPLHSHRQFVDGPGGSGLPGSGAGGSELGSPTTPGGSTPGRRMGAALYS